MNSYRENFPMIADRRRLQEHHEGEQGQQRKQHNMTALVKSSGEKKLLSDPAAVRPPLVVDEHSFLVARAAVIGGDLALVKKLVGKDRGSIIDSRDHFERTILIYATIAGQTDCVQWLVSEGANVKARDKDGMTCVHWAVHKGHHRTLKTLLKKPAYADPLAKDDEGVTPLHLAVKQSSSGNTKCLDVILDYLTKRVDNSNNNNSVLTNALVNVRDNGGRSALHWAAAAGRLPELMKQLKDKVRVTFEEPDSDGVTPLMWSIRSESCPLSCLAYIVDRAPRSVLAQDQQAGYTALHWAVVVDNLPAVELLLQQCPLLDPNLADKELRTPLHWAGILGRPGAASLLIRAAGGAAGAKDAINRADVHGATALHYAAQNNYVETVKTILRHNLEDRPDQDGRTCFMWAAAAGAADAMLAVWNTLKSVEGDEKDKFQATALHLAAKNGHDVVVRFLVDRGWSIDATDCQGLTPLLTAAENGHASTLMCLLKSGAAVWHRDANGRTGLHWAALGGHAFVCQILIKQGLSVDAADLGGRTAVHCAAFGGFLGCLSVLMQAGAHPCRPDNRGATPLHLAASEGHLDVCKRLVDSGSLINAVYDLDQQLDQLGKLGHLDEIGHLDQIGQLDQLGHSDRERIARRCTPLDLASANEKCHVIDYLLANGAMTFQQLTVAAAIKLQAFYRGYRVRRITFTNGKGGKEHNPTTTPNHYYSSSCGSAGHRYAKRSQLINR